MMISKRQKNPILAVMKSITTAVALKIFFSDFQLVECTL